MKTYKLLLEQAVLVLAIPLFIFTSCEQPSEFTSDEDLELKKGKLKIKTPSYEFTEWTGDLPTPCKQVCLVAGQHMNVGNVNVAVVAEGVLVTYEIIEPDIYINEIHLDIFLNEGAFKAAKKISGGGAIPGKFEYKLSWGTDEQITTHSVVIPNEYIQSITGGEDCFYIASHAALSNEETAWGGVCNASDKGVTLVDNVDTEDVEGALQFPGRNWSVYFKFCMDECDESPIDFTYAWEDIRGDDPKRRNDGDYNDFVVQSDVMKTPIKLTIDLTATARGATAVHTFKIKVPMLGVDGITGDMGVDNDGTNYIITVFTSTVDVLPGWGGQPYPWSTNTSPNDKDSLPVINSIIELDINGDFVYDPAIPYEPFITVNAGGFYDLYIYEISSLSTWESKDDGSVYPNGILISDDWQWPLERVFIKEAYPDFPNAGWQNNLADASKVWDHN